MKSIFLLFFLVVFCTVDFAPAKQSAKQPYQARKKPQTNTTSKSQNMQAFIVHCERCIIHISFDEVEIARLKREFGEIGFYEVVDDMNYHNAELWDYARANGIEIEHIEPSEYGFVAFADMTLNTSENKRTHWMYLKDKFPQKIEYLSNPKEEINQYFSLTMQKSSQK